jgi:hypothetical protein
MKSTLATVSNFDGSKDELARAKYILAFLQTGSRAYAAKASGLSVKAHGRIVKMFAQRGNAFDCKRPGRPVLYTEAIMEAAYEMLISQEEDLLTGKQLQRMLCDEGVLQSSSDVDIFMKHLRQYVESQGHRLITNSTKTTFFLAISDVAARLKYCKEMLEELNSRPLSGLIFSDETALEESPHPKGDSQIRPGMCTQYACICATNDRWMVI